MSHGVILFMPLFNSRGNAFIFHRLLSAQVEGSSCDTQRSRDLAFGGGAVRSIQYGGPHKPLQPVRIVVNYSPGFLHPHLSGSTAGYWPSQVTNEVDASLPLGILAAIVELELRQSVYTTGWRILPASW